MPGPKLTVNHDGDTCRLTLADPGGLSNSEICQLATMLFNAVNPAAHLPEDFPDQEFNALYNQGPLLDDQPEIDRDTGVTRHRLTGIVVSPTRFAETVKMAREFGFEVVE